MSRTTIHKKQNASPKNGYEIMKEAAIIVQDDIPEKKLQQIIQSYAQKSNNNYFSLGQQCYYIFSYAANSMLYMDDAAEAITGYRKELFMHKQAYDIFSRLIVEEHVYTTVKFAITAFKLMTDNHNESLTLNLEYNIHTANNTRKRVMMQYRPIVYASSGVPTIVHGHLTDITHIVSDGTPRLSIIVNNKLEEVKLGNTLEILAGTGLPLNTKELSILLMKSRGMRAKEIADSLHMKELSIYSIFRDIKRKTAMDILPLIALLKEKGLLH